MSKIECSACSGSGYYDADGSPPCGACDGTGEVEGPHMDISVSDLRAKGVTVPMGAGPQFYSMEQFNSVFDALLKDRS